MPAATIPESPVLSVSEASVQSVIGDALGYGGWLWHHCKDSQLCSGEAGLPDLVAVHPRSGRVLWIEGRPLPAPPAAGSGADFQEALAPRPPSLPPASLTRQSG